MSVRTHEFEKNIYELELHEEVSSTSVSVARVPGGWIYNYYTDDTGVFVPFNNEFMYQPNYDLSDCGH